MRERHPEKLSRLKLKKLVGSNSLGLTAYKDLVLGLLLVYNHFGNRVFNKQYRTIIRKVSQTPAILLWL